MWKLDGIQSYANHFLIWGPWLFWATRLKLRARFMKGHQAVRCDMIWFSGFHSFSKCKNWENDIEWPHLKSIGWLAPPCEPVVVPQDLALAKSGLHGKVWSTPKDQTKSGLWPIGYIYYIEKYTGQKCSLPCSSIFNTWFIEKNNLVSQPEHAQYISMWSIWLNRLESQFHCPKKTDSAWQKCFLFIISAHVSAFSLKKHTNPVSQPGRSPWKVGGRVPKHLDLNWSGFFTTNRRLSPEHTKSQQRGTGWTQIKMDRSWTLVTSWFFVSSIQSPDGHNFSRDAGFTTSAPLRTGVLPSGQTCRKTIGKSIPIPIDLLWFFFKPEPIQAKISARVEILPQGSNISPSSKFCPNLRTLRFSGTPNLAQPCQFSPKTRLYILARIVLTHFWTFCPNMNSACRQYLYPISIQAEFTSFRQKPEYKWRCRYDSICPKSTSLSQNTDSVHFFSSAMETTECWRKYPVWQQSKYQKPSSFSSPWLEVPRELQSDSTWTWSFQTPRCLKNDWVCNSMQQKYKKHCMRFWKQKS